MIGTIISLKFLGKKPTIAAVGFWVFYFLVALLLGLGVYYIPKYLTILASYTLMLGMIALILLAILWLSLARVIFKMRLQESIRLFGVALFIDIIINGLIISTLVGVGYVDWSAMFPGYILYNLA